MKTIKKAAVLAAGCLGLGMPQMAQANPLTNNAEDIRKLNIMLMVTSLRCRGTDGDFQADYQHFTRVHLDNLNEAGEHLRTNLEARLGKRGSKMALDRIGVGIANGYGDGHPWLDCNGLKQATIQLSQSADPHRLAANASQLLTIPGATQWAGN